jgi:threonine synthase
MILDAVRESRGTCIEVSDQQILDWMPRATAAEGISFCPESSACIAAAEMLRKSGWIKADEQTVIFNCAAGQKYSHLSAFELPRIKNPASVDYHQLAKSLA